MSQFLEDLRTKNLELEVLRLRRLALEEARKVIAEHTLLEGEALELAACELCDRQMAAVKG